MEAAERAKQNLRSLTCYHPSRREEWRDNDWFKTRVPDQTPSRPRFIQSVSDLCRPRSLDPTRTNSIQFSSQWVGRRPMSNSVGSHDLTCLESIKASERDFHLYRWATGPWKLKMPPPGVLRVNARFDKRCSFLEFVWVVWAERTIMACANLYGTFFAFHPIRPADQCRASEMRWVQER